MKVVPIQGRNQVISNPHGMLMFDDVQNVIPAFPIPAFDVFTTRIGADMGQTAGAALFAGYSLIRIHSYLLSRYSQTGANHEEFHSEDTMTLILKNTRYHGWLKPIRGFLCHEWK